jgi:hypothetical protein
MVRNATAKKRLTYSPVSTPGILGSSAITGFWQSDMAFSKERCPFPVDIRRCVVVALVSGATGSAGPEAVAQDASVELATHTEYSLVEGNHTSI